MLLCVLFSLHICEQNRNVQNAHYSTKSNMYKNRSISSYLWVSLRHPHNALCVLPLAEFKLHLVCEYYPHKSNINISSTILYVGSMPEKKWMWCVLGAILHYCIIPSIGFERSRVGTELVSGYECCIYIYCVCWSCRCRWSYG